LYSPFHILAATQANTIFRDSQSCGNYNSVYCGGYIILTDSYCDISFGDSHFFVWNYGKWMLFSAFVVEMNNSGRGPYGALGGVREMAKWFEKSVLHFKSGGLCDIGRGQCTTL
jgi:hypothetical protein